MKIKWLSISALTISLAIPAGMVTAKAYAAQPAAGYSQEGAWDQPPSEFRDVQRQGFHDGIEGARKDFENHRPPNPENRDEFRHPHVSRDLRHDYREGFRRGYETAMHHMMDHHDHDHDHD